MRTTIAVTAVLTLGLMGLATMDDRSPSASAPRPTPPRPVSVRLLGPAEAITGTVVPKDLAGKDTEYLRVQESTDLTVHLPDGRSVRLPVKYVSMNARYGTVIDIHMLPLMETVPYKIAVAELRRCMKVLGITPNEQMKKMMSTWPEDAPGFKPGFYPHTYRAEQRFSESATFLVKVRPSDDGGWFLVLTLAADGDARRAVRHPAPIEPSKKPQAK